MLPDTPPPVLALPIRERLVHRLLSAQGGKCFYCPRRISFDRSPRHSRFASKDHFIPLSRGGSAGMSNVVLSCRRCNTQKANRLPTMIELLRWNELAKIWPHILAVAVDAQFEPKSCIACNSPIPLDRLWHSRECGQETRTCSRDCATKEKARRRRTHQLKAPVVGRAFRVLDTSTVRPMHPRPTCWPPSFPQSV